MWLVSMATRGWGGVRPATGAGQRKEGEQQELCCVFAPPSRFTDHTAPVALFGLELGKQAKIQFARDFSLKPKTALSTKTQGQHTNQSEARRASEKESNLTHTRQGNSTSSLAIGNVGFQSAKELTSLTKHAEEEVAEGRTRVFGP